MTERKINWEMAERIYPGISAEWSEMNRDCSAGYRLGPHMMDGPDVTRSHVEVWLVEWERELSGTIQIVELRSTLVRFPCDDRDVVWKIAPYWRRWASGEWNAPFPMPLGLWNRDWDS